MNKYKIIMLSGQIYFAETDMDIKELYADMYGYEAYTLDEDTLIVVSCVDSIKRCGNG